MTTTTDLRQSAIAAIRDADFRQCWPIEVRKTLVRAAKTEGPFPAYAVRIVENALRTAEGVERRMARQIEAGEAKLTHAQRKALAKSA